MTRHNATEAISVSDPLPVALDLSVEHDSLRSDRTAQAGMGDAGNPRQSGHPEHASAVMSYDPPQTHR